MKFPQEVLMMGCFAMAANSAMCYSRNQRITGKVLFCWEERIMECGAGSDIGKKQNQV